MIVRVDALGLLLEARRALLAEVMGGFFGQGALGGEPDPRPPVSGYSLRTLAELPDHVGLWHRDDLAVLAARYERLRG